MRIWFRASVVVCLLAAWAAMPEQASAAPIVEWSTTVARFEATVAIHGDATFIASTRWRQGGGGRWWAAAQLTKLDATGAVVWTRAWRPPEVHTWAMAVAVSDGAVYVAGDLRPPEGMCSGWFLRVYGLDGSLRWHQEQPGARTCRTSTSAHAIAANDDEVVLATGHWVDGWGTTDGWVRVYNRDGRLEWVRRLVVPGYGDDPYTFVADVAMGPRGIVYAAGAVAARPADIDGDVDQDAVVQRLSPRGSATWTRIFDDGIPADMDFDRLTSVDVGDTTLAVAGRSQRDGSQVVDTWAARLAFDGHTVWRVRLASGQEAVARVSPGGGVLAVWSGGQKGLQLQQLGAAGTRWWRITLTAPEGGVRATGLALGHGRVAVGGMHPAAMGRRTVARVWSLTLGR